MDPASFIGVGLAFGAILLAMTMEGTPVTAILLPPALMLVFLGTLGAGAAGGLMRDTTGMGAQLKRAFLAKPDDPVELVDTLVRLAEKARRDGLLALEDAAMRLTDPFLKKGMLLAIDGANAEELREILEAEVRTKRKADLVGAKVFLSMGGYAPTIGIIGTVIGLVHVLSNLSQPQQLGELIAGAFVATLWGVLSANALWLPIANRLRRLSDVECGQMELAIAGILHIQEGVSPRLVAQRLRSLLPPGSPGRRQAA